jgi:hypothetical protein
MLKNVTANLINILDNRFRLGERYCNAQSACDGRFYPCMRCQSRTQSKLLGKLHVKLEVPPPKDRAHFDASTT